MRIVLTVSALVPFLLLQSAASSQVSGHNGIRDEGQNDGPRYSLLDVEEESLVYSKWLSETNYPERSDNTWELLLAKSAGRDGVEHALRGKRSLKSGVPLKRSMYNSVLYGLSETVFSPSESNVELAFLPDGELEVTYSSPPEPTRHTSNDSGWGWLFLLASLVVVIWLIRKWSKHRQLRFYMKGAEHGDASAQMELAKRYYYGEKVKQDYSEARRWYQAAADTYSLAARTASEMAAEASKRVNR